MVVKEYLYNYRTISQTSMVLIEWAANPWYLVVMDAKRFDISIVEAHVDKRMVGMGKIGLCMKRFRADVVMDETQFENLHVDDVVGIEDRRLRIVQVGKECFDGCELHENGAYCPLKDSCAFGMWEE